MTPTHMRGRVLIIAGSDSGGGAGLQADVKTVTALGSYASTAVTAITVQNTLGVFAIHPVPLNIVREQIARVLSDIGADVIKIGMLGSAEIIECVADAISEYAVSTPLIIDPVMMAKGGTPLLPPAALSALKHQLLPRAALLTPNLPEAELLVGSQLRTIADMRNAAPQIIKLGPKAVLMKGGHLAGDDIHDFYAGSDGTHEWCDRRIPTRHTHGTGCTLASAIAAGLAQNVPILNAIGRARDYVRVAIATAPGLGSGHGPLNHAHTFRPFKE